MTEKIKVNNGHPGLVKDIWLAVPLHELITTPTELRKEGDEKKRGFRPRFTFQNKLPCKSQNQEHHGCFLTCDALSVNSFLIFL